MITVTQRVVFLSLMTDLVSLLVPYCEHGFARLLRAARLSLCGMLALLISIPGLTIERRLAQILHLAEEGNPADPRLIKMWTECRSPFSSDPEPAKVLGELGLDDRSAIPALVAVLRKLNTYDYDRRQAAAFALGETRDPAAIPALVAALKDENDYVRSAAVIALGCIDGPAAIPALLAALTDSEEHIRIYAARTLGRIGHPAAIPALVRALEDESIYKYAYRDYVRKEAAEALREVGNPGAISSLNKNSSQAVPQTDIGTWEGLTRRASNTALVAAMRVLRDDGSSYRERHGAAGVLGDIPDPAAIPTLIVILNNKRSDVRAEAAEALDREAWVRQAAAKALGRIGGPAAVTALLGALDDENPWVRITAAGGLQRLGHPSSAQAFVELLKDGNPIIRAIGVEALSAPSTPAQVTALRGAMVAAAESADLRIWRHIYSELPPKGEWLSLLRRAPIYWLLSPMTWGCLLLISAWLASSRWASARLSGFSTSGLLALILVFPIVWFFCWIPWAGFLLLSLSLVLAAIRPAIGLKALPRENGSWPSSKRVARNIVAAESSALIAMGLALATTAGVFWYFQASFWRQHFLTTALDSLLLSSIVLLAWVLLGVSSVFISGRFRPWLRAQKQAAGRACKSDYHRFRPPPDLPWPVRWSGRLLMVEEPPQHPDFARCLICRYCGQRDFVPAEQIAGVIGRLPEPVSENPTEVLVPLFDASSRKACSADIDRLEIHEPPPGTHLDYDYAVNAVLIALSEDSHRSRSLKKIPVRIHGQPQLSLNTRRMLADRFGAMREVA